MALLYASPRTKEVGKVKKAPIIIGYFVVAVAFFALGVLVSNKVKLPASQQPHKETPEPQGLRLESLEVKPVISPQAVQGQIVQPAQTASQQVIPPGTTPISDPSPSIGSRQAKVVVLEVSDFQCPVCKRAFAPLKDLAKDFPGQVLLVFKHNPLQMHRFALDAASAAIAAHKQGKFWEYADILFENQSALAEQNLLEYARRLGLDMDRFQKDFRDAGTRSRALSEGQEASSFGARGTPSFFINGKMQVGWGSYEGIKQMVASEISKVDELLATGMSLQDARIARVKANLGGDADKFLAGFLGREFKSP
jgi:protein-disulfide isomerase